MTKSIIKVLLFTCFCFNSEATCNVDSMKISNSDHGSTVNIRFKNTDPHNIDVTAKIYRGKDKEDGTTEWSPSIDHKCSIAGSMGDTISVDLSKDKNKDIDRVKADLIFESTNKDGEKEIIGEDSRIIDVNSGMDKSYQNAASAA